MTFFVWKRNSEGGLTEWYRLVGSVPCRLRSQAAIGLDIDTFCFRPARDMGEVNMMCVAWRKEDTGFGWRQQ